MSPLLAHPRTQLTRQLNVTTHSPGTDHRLSCNASGTCTSSPTGHGNPELFSQPREHPDRSHTSTPSSALSSMSSYSKNYPPTLTPITNSESSPPDNMSSPSPRKRTFDHIHGNGTLAPTTQNPAISKDLALTPTQSPPDLRPQARPGPGQVKGQKLVFDPDTASGLDPSNRKRLKPRYNTFGDTHDAPPTGDPRLLFPDYPLSVFRNDPKPNKARLRPAPYTLRPWSWDSKHSVGRGPAEQVVVSGFDPLLISESKIRAMLSQYGEVTALKNLTDPSTGSFLAICSVSYGDRKGLKRSAKAVESARRAEKEGNGQRIDQCQVKVERDPEGLRSKRYAEAKINHRKVELQKQLHQDRPYGQRPPPPPPPPPPSVLSAPALAVSAPPPNAPKGPSGRAPPPGPRFVPPPPRPAAHSLVEQEDVLPKLRRKPYIFIAHCYVPVLGTTIAHLEKRLKSYNWREIRCDQTGYYIVFEDTKPGQYEAVRLHETCNFHQLFTYTMNMELQKYGNPNYIRSPTPARVAAEQAAVEERTNIKEEDEKDFQKEIQERATQLDPTLAAIEKMLLEMHDIVLGDVKSKQGTQKIYKVLDPHAPKNVEVRKKFNLADPTVVETQRAFPLARSDGTRTVGTPDSRSEAIRPYRKHPLNRKDLRQNAYLDDRRAARTRIRQPRALHQILQDLSESDDERRTTVTRGSDGLDSRAISEAARSPARFEVDDEGHLTPRTKRQRTDRWAHESDEESVDFSARKVLGGLLDNEPEDLSDTDLERIVNNLPTSDAFRKRALQELKHRRKVLDDERLFLPDAKHKAPGVVDITLDDTDSVSQAAATPEPVGPTKPVKKKAIPKTKKKTKKQLQEEDAARAEMEAKLDKLIEKAEAEEEPAVAAAEPEPMVETRAEVEWGVSTTEPRQTVEDDFGIVLDVDGWQHFVKDNEDLSLLKVMLQKLPIEGLECDPDLWSFNRKHFKSLNTGGAVGISHTQLEIPGYYVPNRSGCARTEPFQKIKESEKSQYLPHRIKVKNLREQRQAEAKKNPNGVPELVTAKATGKGSVASQRSNRVENRRVQNDMVNVAQNLSTESNTFQINALKKRKKCVRFDRSAIHGWGLYAEENIANNEMIIEYVGEKVRQRIADVREVTYELQGVGSSYLFRIDDDMVIDATKKGGIARFINHSCMPNCTAKIIKVDGGKRIVIYAQRDISKDEELTYDYKFEREIHSGDRIPCLCGTVACKGFLN